MYLRSTYIIETRRVEEENTSVLILRKNNRLGLYFNEKFLSQLIIK
jgi:hypothetical protein